MPRRLPDPAAGERETEELLFELRSLGKTFDAAYSAPIGSAGRVTADARSGLRSGGS